MTDRIAHIRADAEAAIAGAGDTEGLENVRIQYLGRKAELPNLLRNVAELPAAERAATGRAANEARKALEAAIDQRAEQLAAAELDKRLERDRVDVTLPSDPVPATGRLHLITQTQREIEDVFIGLGFNIAEGPEVETVYYNFDALNFESTHPSRLMSDTFYVQPTEDIFDPSALLLRVHTSPVQIRSMESQVPPI
jgi:phenylalanyl-tRNA synthetase alpha chain